MSEWNDTSDRRAVPRRACRACFCRLLDGRERRAEVRDISASGVGLLCDGSVWPGQLVDLRLGAPGTAVGLALQARVTHVRERADGRWPVGCAFDRRLPDALVALLL
jgi:hypothetical protein